MAAVERYPDCEHCEAPCCRRQFMEDDDGWFRLEDIRPIYQAAGTDVRVVSWVKQPDGRQPMIACDAFQVTHQRYGSYASRPEHCPPDGRRRGDPRDRR